MSEFYDQTFEIEPENTSELSSKAGVVKCWKQFCFIMDISTSTSVESQTNFDLATSQLIPTNKPLQIITSKDSSTDTIEEGKETFVHVAIQSLKDHINSLEYQLKDKHEIIDRLFNFNSALVTPPVETVKKKKKK